MTIPTSLPRTLALAFLGLGALALAACGGGGGHHHDPVFLGDVFVINDLEDSGTPEDIWGFFMAPAGSGAFTGNLLSEPLFWEDEFDQDVAFVGAFEEGPWDWEAEDEFGFIIVADTQFIFGGVENDIVVF